MSKFIIERVNRTLTWATVEADSAAGAIEKAKRGEYSNDIDSEPGGTDQRSFKCIKSEED